MQCFFQIIQIIIIITIPLLSKWLTKTKKIPDWLSPVVICYTAGILFSNFPVFPTDRQLASTFSEVSILFAIPLLLYSTNIMNWFRYARNAIFAFMLCAISGAIAASIATYLFKNSLLDTWKLAGMAAGLYTGGTPNMQTIGLALQTPQEIIILMNAADVFTGGIYLVILTSIAHRILGFILPSFTNKSNDNDKLNNNFNFSPFNFIDIVKGISVTIIVISISLGLTWIIFKKMDQPIFIMLMLTTLSIIASFFIKIRQIPGTFEIGEFFLLMFCISLGTLADFEKILAEGKEIIVFLASVLTLTVIINVILAKIFRVDRDTMLVTSTAGIYGPAFVGQVTTAIGNKELVFSGMAMGLLGYAIGNYWGIGLAYMLKWLFF